MSHLDLIRSFIAWMASLPEVQIIAASILLNTALAVAASIRNDEFKLPELASFLYKHLLPYVVIYAAARIAGDELGLGAIAPAVWLIIEASLVGRIIASLRELGVPIPDELARRVAKRQ